MSRASERLIDAFVLAMLLLFAYVMRREQPGLAGVIVMAGIQFWMSKNASPAKEPPMQTDSGQTYLPLILVFVIGFILGALCYANGILVG